LYIFILHPCVGKSCSNEPRNTLTYGITVSETVVVRW